jgi:hypothetical protein
MKIKFFQPGTPLHGFRWFILITIAVASLMTYADLTGWRLFAFSDGKQWSASGPGYHK